MKFFRAAIAIVVLLPLPSFAQLPGEEEWRVRESDDYVLQDTFGNQTTFFLDQYVLNIPGGSLAIGGPGPLIGFENDSEVITQLWTIGTSQESGYFLLARTWHSEADVSARHSSAQQWANLSEQDALLVVRSGKTADEASQEILQFKAENEEGSDTAGPTVLLTAGAL